MKKHLLFSLLIFYCFISSAQYKKMPLDTNHYWNEVYSYIQGSTNCNCNYQYEAVKDTVILGIIYKKVLRTNIICVSPCSPYNPYKAFLRQDTVLRKVIILDNTFQEKILFNFKKNVGDTALLYDVVTSSSATYTVGTKDSLLLSDGLYHRRFIYNGGCCGGTVIEGVGGYYSLLSPYIIGFGLGTNLVCLGKTYPTNGTIYHMSGNTFSCS